MARYQASSNTSQGNSIQINGPVYGNISSASDLQPRFFKTSNYESHKDNNPERVPETCVWFLEHPTFQNWKASSGNNLLWLSADPGCGKSVLSRALIDEKLVSAEPVTLCYFFFKDNDEQNNTTTAFCALLHQFFCAHNSLLEKHVNSAMKKCGKALKNDFEELWRIFISAATDPSAGDVVCILDALDECQEYDRNKLIIYLERFYIDGPKQGSKLKFLVTSRPYNEIELRFFNLTRKIPTIRLAGEEESEKISHEIGIVMKSKIKEIATTLELNEDVESSLHYRLQQIPNRTYLWLHLVLEEVSNSLGRTAKKLRRVLDTLPRTVEEAYENILRRCKQEEARRVLYIVVAARRTLTLSEIDEALEIRTDLASPSLSYVDLDCEGVKQRKIMIRNSCGLFISVVDSRVFLIHQTAREFLVRKSNEMAGPSGWKHSIDLQEAHRVLSEKCVTYLLLREFQDYQAPPLTDTYPHSGMLSVVDQYIEKYPFLYYSATYWISHVQEAHNDSGTWLSKTTKLCDVGDGSSHIWFNIYSRLYYTRDPFDKSEQSPLYWAAVFGLISETRFLLNSGSDSSMQGDFF